MGSTGAAGRGGDRGMDPVDAPRSGRSDPAHAADPLLLGAEKRRDLWTRTIAAVEGYIGGIAEHRVAPPLDPVRVRELLRPFDFSRGLSPAEALEFVVRGLWEHQVHTPHPRYFGLFNPAPTSMGVAADALVAAFNPQLAAWSHSPFANEVERHLLRAFGERFGYEADATDGTFTAGGMEANHTAVVVALAASFPAFASQGVRALPGQPVLYVSAEAHHSFLKAARLCGLGTDAVREIPVDAELRMRPDALAERIRSDREAGHAPFLVVATAGTTNAGALDPVAEVAEIAAEEGVWMHLDAAWGGAAALVPELSGLLSGSARAESITFDAHKWLSVPMGAGMFLTRRAGALDAAFRTSTSYMPREAAALEVADPFAHSMQWSRRAIGMKVFLSLAVAGWEGYEEAIRHQAAMGDLLREELAGRGWRIANRTALPVVCFTDATRPDGGDAAYLEGIAREIVSSGLAWISTTAVGGGVPVLRACITNYRTGPDEIRALVEGLERARVAAAPAPGGGTGRPG